MENELRASMYIVIADACLDIFEKARVSDYMTFATQIRNILTSTNQRFDMVSSHITNIYLKVNIIYSFPLEEMVKVIQDFFIHNHFKSYLPVLQSVRRTFGPYVNLTK